MRTVEIRYKEHESIVSLFVNLLPSQFLRRGLAEIRCQHRSLNIWPTQDDNGCLVAIIALIPSIITHTIASGYQTYKSCLPLLRFAPDSYLSDSRAAPSAQLAVSIKHGDAAAFGDPAFPSTGQ